MPLGLVVRVRIRCPATCVCPFWAPMPIPDMGTLASPQVVGPCVEVARVERTGCLYSQSSSASCCTRSATTSVSRILWVPGPGPLRLWRDFTPCQEWRQYRCITTSLGHATPILPFSSITSPCCTSCRCLHVRPQTRRSS